MNLWELVWWEILAFAILFGIDVYLIIKAPSCPDPTKKRHSCQSISSEDSSDKLNLSINQKK
jgi:hypothetical protein